MTFEKAVIIRDKTRLEQLIERFNSKAQAKFYIGRSGGNFAQYEREHEVFYHSINEVQQKTSAKIKAKAIFRSFLPSYLFTDSDLVIVVGQDGLVANTAKYVNGLPIIAINPDPKRYDGVLLPFKPDNFEKALGEVLGGRYSSKAITMAEAKTKDGQRLLAFNDFYIGAASHVSSRYKIAFGGEEENQSSSGIIVSTGAGSTGWLSSIFNMAHNINGYHDESADKFNMVMGWEDRRLVFVVREPFLSKASGVGIGFGTITKDRSLLIESHMPNNGVIFSDGVESDFLKFNSGSTVEIGIAKEKARLIT